MADSSTAFPPGKLPAELLAHLIQRYSADDERVIIGPRVGADAAAIDMGDRVLVAKTDPITFPAQDSGRYLVNVNANDIACMGADPRWLLVTTLLPEKESTAALVETIFAGLAAAADALGITLVGGHTEITIGLDRPILIGQMLGETTRSRLLDLRRSRVGDHILLCNGIAIEGTSILANAASSAELQSVSPEMISAASRFLVEPGISVVPAARALEQSGATLRGLHDPTEGGLATALHELAEASRLGLEIERRAIQVFPETDALCTALNLDPMGLIASGALLAVVSAATSKQAIEALRSAGIDASVIGTMVDDGSWRVIHEGTGTLALQRFEVDEIARYFAGS